MSNNTALAANIIPRDQIAAYVSPETYQVTDSDGITHVYYNGEPVTPLGVKKALDNVWVHPEPGFQHGRCKMIKRTGDRCRQPVRAGWTVCQYHGAGTPDRPAGHPPENGRYSKHLPTRFMADFEDSLNDPNQLSLRMEMALIDVRMGDLLRKLETSDSVAAWNRVAVSAAMIAKLANGEDEDNDNMRAKLANAADILQRAVTEHRDEKEVWDDLIAFIDERRKIADVERRRIEAAKKYLTLQEANAMMAYFVSSVMKHCSSSQERARISEDLRVFATARSD